MERHGFRITTLAILVATLITGPPTLAAELSPSLAGWAAVSDDVLAGMRGGMQIGQLNASIGIEREVRIDGQLVSRAYLVFSNLGQIARGKLPDVRSLGDLATNIRVEAAGLVPGSAGSEAVAAAAVAAANAAMAPATEISRTPIPGASRGTDGAAANAAPVAGTGNSGVTSTSNIASGATPHFGDALERAVGIATGEGPSYSAPVPAQAAGASSRNSAAPASASVSTRSIVIPLPNGQTIVVNNLPDPTRLATSIQNFAQGTSIDTRTTINASVQGTLDSLRSGALAAAIREQAMQAVKR